MRKVKPQPIGRHQRPVLFHMRPQQIPQGGMHQMRRRMIAGRIVPGATIHGELQPLPSRIEPDVTTPLCTIKVGTGLVVSRISTRPSGPVRSP